MNIAQRSSVQLMIVILGLTVTASACGQSPAEDSKPVVTVYATPT